MPAHSIITVPQPCAESWAAMTPTSTGRHCAACQKNVVDFTLKTDTEILALLAQASAGSVCGRFRTEQLARPLRELAAPARSRWRNWLAAALAVWATREGLSSAAGAQAASRPVVHRPAKRNARPHHPGLVPVTLRGVVREAGTQSVLPGATVKLRGASNSRCFTDADGRFVLKAWAKRQPSGRYTVEVRMIGYHTAPAVLPNNAAGPPTEISLAADESVATVQVTGYGTSQRVEYTGGAVVTIRAMEVPLQPDTAARDSRSRLRSFFYQLTRPFRRS